MSTPRIAALLCIHLGCAAKQPPAAPPPAPIPAPAPVVAVAEPAATPAPAPEPAQPGEPVLPWPADCPPLAGARVLEVARISANVGDSPAGAVYIAAAGELQATYLAWREAAVARGMRVLAEHTAEQVRAASLVDAAGQHVYMLLQQSGADELAGIYNRGRRPPVALRGPCVVPPARARVFDVERSALGHGGEYHHDRGLVHVETRFGHDLDADGELDLLVPSKKRAACPRDLTWTVYLARNGCFHEVGEVGPGELEYGEPPAAGPRPLVFTSEAVELGSGGTNTTTVRSTYMFVRSRSTYVRSDRKKSEATCFHCTVQQCRPPP